MFSLCLGKNGGYFRIGGFDTAQHLEPIKWVAMDQQYQISNYKFKIMGVSVNGHPISGSNKFSIGFIDSGTTFSYLPAELYDSLLFHFDNFCKYANKYDNDNSQKSKYCPGKFFYSLSSEGEKVACFKFDQEKYRNKTKEWMMGYPVINIHVKQIDGTVARINWFPSEYLYLDKDGSKYCLAADRSNDY